MKIGKALVEFQKSENLGIESLVTSNQEIKDLYPEGAANISNHREEATEDFCLHQLHERPREHPTTLAARSHLPKSLPAAVPDNDRAPSHSVCRSHQRSEI